MWASEFQALVGWLKTNENEKKKILCGSGRFLVVVSTSGCGGEGDNQRTALLRQYVALFTFSLLADELFGTQVLCMSS